MSRWVLGGAALIVGAIVGGFLVMTYRPTYPQVQEVVIDAENCQAVTVTPWAAGVKRGRSLSWRVNDADQAEIVPKSEADWPFDERRGFARPREPFQASNARGPVGARYRYSIILTCGEQVLDIDPEVVIVW